MKKNILILILFMCLILSMVLNLKFDSKFDNNENNNLVGNDFKIEKILPSSVNNFNAFERQNLYQIALKYGFDDFDLEKSGFFTTRVDKFRIYDDENDGDYDTIIPGVYLSPKDYAILDVNVNNGAVKGNTNIDLNQTYIPYTLKQVLQILFDFSLNSDDDDTLDIEYYSCESIPYCGGTAITQYTYDQNIYADYSLTVGQFMQLMQEAYNKENAIKLYPDYDVYLTEESPYFQYLSDNGLLTEVQLNSRLYNIDDDTKVYELKFSHVVSKSKTVDQEFLDVIYDYFPDNYTYGEPIKDEFVYFNVYKTNIGYNIRYGVYDYDAYYNYMSDSYPDMPKTSNDIMYLPVCPYQTSSEDILDSCNPNYIYYNKQ